LVRSREEKLTGIYVGSLDSTDAEFLTQADEAQYVPPGFLLFRRNNNLMAQAFDATSLKLSGEPVLISSLGYSFGAFANFSVSKNGVLATRYYGSANKALEWFDREGRPLGSIGKAGPYSGMALSPDEARVVVERGVESPDLWIIDLERDGVASRFTFDPGWESDPIWSRDGREIAFSSNRNAVAIALYRKSLAGNEEADLLLESKQNLWMEDWSEDGRFITYLSIPGGIWVLPLLGDQEPFPVIETPFNLDEPQLSPDGRWLAYISDESGQFEVYVQPFQGEGERLRISTEGGGQPRWRGDGREIFYLALDGTMMVVTMSGEDTLEPSVPEPLFQTDIAVVPTIDQFAVTSDGQRFLILTPTEEAAASITVVLNWTASLDN
jgi:hypothetical protein